MNIGIIRYVFIFSYQQTFLSPRYVNQVVIGSKVGRAKHMRIMPGGALEADKDLSGPSSVFVGRKLDEHRGAFLLEYPMDKGAVTEGSWDAMERLWEVSQMNRFWTVKEKCISPLLVSIGLLILFSLS